MAHIKPEFVSTLEAAELLGVTKSRVDQFCRKGRIPSVIVGKSRVLRRADVEAFKKEPRETGRPKTKF